MIIEQKIGTLTKISNTQVQLTGLSVVKLGGQYKSLTNPTLLTSVSGIGGIDTGAITASSFYYVYAVSTGSVEGLVASLSATSPTGFARYKKVGAFYTDPSSQIFKSYILGESNQQTLCLHVNNAGGIVSQFPTWASSISKPGTGVNDINIASNILTIAPIAVANVFGGTGSERQSYLVSASTTTIRVVTENSSAGSDINEPFSIIVHKQGVDAIQPDWKDY